MASSGDIVISSAVYKARLNRLFDIWNSSQNEDVWFEISAIILISGRQEEEKLTPKTDQLQ